MCALGHHDQEVTDEYTGKEEEPLHLHKASIPEGRIDRHILIARTPYDQPSPAEMRRLISEHIQSHPEVIAHSSKDLALFIGRGSSKANDPLAFNERHHVREMAGTRVRQLHQQEWAEAQSGPPQSPLVPEPSHAERPTLGEGTNDVNEAIGGASSSGR